MSASSSNKQAKPPVTLRTKIVFIFLLLIAIPLIVQGVVTYVEFSQSVERKTVGYTGQIVGQINRSLDQTLREEMHKISLLPLYNDEVMQIMEKYSNSGSEQASPILEEKNKMFHYISGSTYYRPEIRGIQFIAGNGYVFTSMDPFLVRPFIRPEREPWYNRVVRADGAWVMLPQHKPDYMLEDAGPSLYVSAARLIREPGSTELVGMMKIDFRLDIFEQIAASYKFAEIGNLLVVNSDKELFYEQNNEHMNAIAREMIRTVQLPEGGSTAKVAVDGATYLTVADRSDYSGLTVISFIPMTALLNETKTLRSFTLMTFIVCLIAAGLLAVYYSYKLSRPLVQLRNKMQLVEQGLFKQHVQVHSQDEIGQLNSGFNRMSEEIDRLVNEVYAIGLKEKEAQLSALLAQMNPHFMYNTLESINMMAIEKQAYDISDMVTALGKLLRHSIGTYDRLVPLETELAFAANYIRIQRIRYGSRLNAVFQAEEGLDRLLVPKLILQPLVENAVYHGIGDMREGGTIWVTAVRFGNDLLLTVSDNGKGCTEEELALLRERIENGEGPAEESSGGLALRSLHQRIRLLYGETYGLELDGAPDRGASFTITIPADERSETDV